MGLAQGLSEPALVGDTTAASSQPISFGAAGSAHPPEFLALPLALLYFFCDIYISPATFLPS